MDAPPAESDLPRRLRVALDAVADPERAPAMRAYLKSTLPFRGVPLPLLRRVVRPLIAAERLLGREAWEGALLELWEHPVAREDRYAAIELARHRRFREWQTPGALPLYRHLIVTGAWWDLVDPVASDLVGPIVRSDPAAREQMRSWAVNDSLWVRRASIICQLGSRAELDTGLLAEAIEANLTGTRHGGEFFIRKAIGWALRQHARTDPAWVRAFVLAHEGALSALSRREGLKHLG